MKLSITDIGTMLLSEEKLCLIGDAMVSYVGGKSHGRLHRSDDSYHLVGVDGYYAHIRFDNGMSISAPK